MENPTETRIQGIFLSLSLSFTLFIPFWSIVFLKFYDNQKYILKIENRYLVEELKYPIKFKDIFAPQSHYVQVDSRTELS